MAKRKSKSRRAKTSDADDKFKLMAEVRADIGLVDDDVENALKFVSFIHRNLVIKSIFGACPEPVTTRLRMLSGEAKDIVQFLEGFIAAGEVAAAQKAE